jgi:hypothetical protein
MEVGVAEVNNAEGDYPKRLEDILYRLKEPFLDKTDDLATQDVSKVKNMVDERIEEIYKGTINILTAIKNNNDSSLTESTICNIVGEKEKAQCLLMQESGIPFALHQNKGLFGELEASAKRVLYEYTYVLKKGHANTLKKLNKSLNTPQIVNNTETIP